MSLISLRNIKKVYEVGGEVVKALDGIDLSIEENEYLAIMGASGSGKGTWSTRCTRPSDGEPSPRISRHRRFVFASQDHGYRL